LRREGGKLESMNALQVILIAGLTCGVLDWLSAVALAKGRWMRVFQFVASSILGPGSFQGGVGTASVGISLHFLIALSATAIYYSVSRRAPILIDRALLFGVLYGVAIHFFMTFVVIPMSRIGPRPLVLRAFLMQLAVHMIVVGPTIALMIRRYSR
jgi:hypothetical protein